MLISIVHLGQQAVMVDLDLGLFHGCRHSFLDVRVAEAGHARLRRWEDYMDTISPDAKAEQSLYGGEDVNAVSVNNGIIWRDTRKKQA